jgi:hypothetical protein
MGLLDWLGRGRRPKEDARITQWKQSWSDAVAAPTADAHAALSVSLDALGLTDDEVEIEREMLDGLEKLTALAREVSERGLPVVETGHRVVGTDPCHFSAPASMPEEPNQPSGRLLLTGARAIFVGGASARTLPWHAIAKTLQADRDIVLVRTDATAVYRFRSNSFSDALCGAFVARRLVDGRRRVL